MAQKPSKYAGVAICLGGQVAIPLGQGSLLPGGHLSGGTNGGSRIKPGFSYHLSLLKSQVIEGTTGPPIEDKKAYNYGPNPREHRGFPHLYTFGFPAGAAPQDVKGCVTHGLFAEKIPAPYRV